MFLLELTSVDHHGTAAAAFAFMYALGGSMISLLGAIHPFWRLNMLAMAAVALMTVILVILLLPESPIWLLRKGKVSQAETSMREIHGDNEFINDFMLMKFAHKEMMKEAESKQNNGNNLSAPLRTILTDVVTQKKRLPRPPFSFAFLVVLYTCIGWSGFTSISLNGPKLFQVKLYRHANNNNIASCDITESSSRSGD